MNTAPQARYTAAQMVEDMTDPMQPVGVIHGQRRDWRSIRLSPAVQEHCDRALSMQMAQQDNPLNFPGMA